MRRVILSVSAVLLLAACGGGDDGPGRALIPGTGDAGSPAGTSPPAPQWKADPGQRDDVIRQLTAESYACSSMDGDRFSFTVCAKPPENTLSKSLNWMKFVSAPDGTVVHVRSNSANYHRTGMAAIMGAKDAGVLSAGGKNLSWGTTGDGVSVSVLGLTAPPEPPGPAGFGVAKEDVLGIYQPDPAMDCRLSDPTPAPTPSRRFPRPSSSPSVAPVPTSMLSCSRRPDDYYSPEVSVAAVATGSEVTGLELFVDQKSLSPENDPNRGPQDYTPEEMFAKAKPALLTQAAKLWPALKGPDVAAIRAWAEERIVLNKNSLGYVAGRRVEVVSSRNSTYGLYQIRVTVGPERPDLSEPGR